MNKLYEILETFTEQYVRDDGLLDIGKYDEADMRALLTRTFNKGVEEGRENEKKEFYKVSGYKGFPATGKREPVCPPHNMQDYHFVGGWSASVPPPTKQCTKCLMTI